MADLKRWSQDEITRMRTEMDRLFDDLCSDFDLPVLSCRMTGDLDLREVGNTLVARLELGTMNPEDVHVAVFDRRLVISAESVTESAGRRQSQMFRKELKLPCVILPDEVCAEFDDGVLEVHLPKCPSQRGQVIAITKK